MALGTIDATSQRARTRAGKAKPGCLIGAADWLTIREQHVKNGSHAHRSLLHGNVFPVGRKYKCLTPYATVAGGVARYVSCAAACGYINRTGESGSFIEVTGLARSCYCELTLTRATPAAIEVSSRGVATAKVDFAAAHGYHRADAALVCGTVLVSQTIEQDRLHRTLRVADDAGE